MNGGGEGPATSGAAATVPLDWKFSQVFGERTAGEEVQEGTVLDSRFSIRLLSVSFSLVLFVQRCDYHLLDDSV